MSDMNNPQEMIVGCFYLNSAFTHTRCAGMGRDEMGCADGLITQCVNASIEIHKVTSAAHPIPSHPIPSQRSVCVTAP